VITENSTLPLTTTNFNTSTSKVAPLTFTQFDTDGGSRVLDSVTLNFSAQIQNQFGMQFTTPATITDSVATNNPSQPGPVITLDGPNGKPLVTAQVPNDPSLLERTVTYGGKAGQTLPQTFSSSLPSTSPFYIAPAVTTATGSQTLTSAADLKSFLGTGSVSLPVSAAASSMFTSSSGNGFGSVTTEGTASVQVTYTWHPNVPSPELVPEPATVVLWGAGVLALFAAHRVRRPA
jgi:hypothetical protein